MPRFVEWFSDPEVRRYLDMYLPFSLAQEERWFEHLQERMEKKEIVMLTIETKDGAHIGNISLFDINWKDRHAELGITIGERDYWGRGYGSDAIQTLLHVAFEEMNLHRVHLRVHADNARGINCYKKVGFQKEGTQRESVFREGVYRDVEVMSILESEFEHRD
ncbi:MAG: GNAT family N-acetyltransferase [Anaerolineae bacterium]|nr:GNAT family N-acetyltransferase [Anaerolineae bacterium]